MKIVLQTVIARKHTATEYWERQRWVGQTLTQLYEPRRIVRKQYTSCPGDIPYLLLVSVFRHQGNSPIARLWPRYISDLHNNAGENCTM